MFKKNWGARLTQLLSALLLTAVAGGCSASADDRIREDREVDEFHVVNASISGRIYLVRGDEAGLQIEAEPATLAQIVTEVDDGVLRIHQEDGGGWWRNSGPILIRIRYETLDGLEMSGSADVQTDWITTENFTVKISGSSNINIPQMSVESLKVRVSGSGDLAVGELTAEVVHLQVSGSGDVVLAGATESLAIAVNGSGNVDSEGLEVQSAEVSVGGSGDVAVRVREDLDVHITGSGNVDYWGNPTVTSRVSGSGDLDKR